MGFYSYFYPHLQVSCGCLQMILGYLQTYFSLSLSLSPHLGSFLAQWNNETLAFENSVLGVNGV